VRTYANDLSQYTQEYSLYRKASVALLSSDSGVKNSIIRSLIFKESFILMRNCVVRNNISYFISLAILVIMLVLVNNKQDRRASKNSIFLLKYRRKIRNKKLGAHQPRDFKLQQSGKNQNRSFSTSWFYKKR
jgi:hypothetical protein